MIDSKEVLKGFKGSSPIFPLPNFVMFPKTAYSFNIFEKRYLEMIDDAMKSDRIIGMIQPKESNQNLPLLYNIGCAGKITSFKTLAIMIGVIAEEISLILIFAPILKSMMGKAAEPSKPVVS